MRIIASQGKFAILNVHRTWCHNSGSYLFPPFNKRFWNIFEKLLQKLVIIQIIFLFEKNSKGSSTCRYFYQFILAKSLAEILSCWFSSRDQIRIKHYFCLTWSHVQVLIATSGLLHLRKKFHETLSKSHWASVRENLT